MSISVALQNLVNVIVSPRTAFANLGEKPSVWFPLLLLICAWIVFWQWYFHAVDYPWLIDHMINFETQKAPAEHHQAIRDGITKLKPAAMVILSSLIVIVVLSIITVLTAFYLVIVSAVVDDHYKFKNWFSLTLWTSVPSLFSILAMTLNFVLAPDGRVPPENLNPISLKNMLGMPPGQTFSTLLDSIDLTSFWTWGLLVMAYQQWTKRTWVQSATAVLVPVFGIYAVWALLAWL